jgi:hypothetical protein
MKFFSQLLTRASYDPQPAIDFQVAFNKAGPAVKTNIKHLGKLHVPTGSIVICDGIVINDAKPLSQKIPAGDYDVSVLISEQGSKDAPNERYALAKLTVSNNPAVKWQLATTDGQNIHKLKPGEYFGYAIDAGVGCFMDEQTYREYDEFSEEICKKNPNANFYDDYLADLFKKNAKNPSYRQKRVGFLPSLRV